MASLPTIPDVETNQRLVCVSNRLPVTLKKKADGQYESHMSSGGLVTALSGVKKTTDFLWYGWTGDDGPKLSGDAGKVEEELRKAHNAVPVWLDKEVAETHYNGFSNSILWPLFHFQSGDMNFTEVAWSAYQDVNRTFAKEIAKEVRDGDMIWIHDYHLMLLPKMLKEILDPNLSNVKIGFFLHTTFPSSEIYESLPVSAEILHGLLECSLIGFHTYEYTRNFLSSCRSLGIPVTPNGVQYNGKTVTVAAFPIGIDPDKFVESLKKESVKQRIAELEHSFEGKKVICGVDRLDYIKGVPQKLHAIEELLESHPEYRGKIVLQQVAVPSRGDVAEYQSLREVVERTVGRINGKYSTFAFSPITLMHRSVDFDELVALYAVSDVVFITSTRDGMNLVSFEYIACQEKKHGQLVLSEFTGAAQCLNGAILIDPGNTEGMVDALVHALKMSDIERKTNFDRLYEYVTKYTSAYWGESFVTELKRISSTGQGKIKMRRGSGATSARAHRRGNGSAHADAITNGVAKLMVNGVATNGDINGHTNGEGHH